MLKLLVEKTINLKSENTDFLTSLNAGGSGNLVKHTPLMDAVCLAEPGAGQELLGQAGSLKTNASCIPGLSWKWKFQGQSREQPLLTQCWYRQGGRSTRGMEGLKGYATLVAYVL